MAAIFRQINILQLLPRQPRRVSTSDLRQRLEERGLGEQHIRTIQRDLVHLSRFFPICSDDNRPAGWSWISEAPQFSLPDLDPRSALTLHMTNEFLTRMLPGNCVRFLDPHFHRAAEVLDALPESCLGSWREKVAVASRQQPLLSPEIEPQILEVVYDALLEERQFQGTYCTRSGDGVHKDYRVHPLGLIFADQVIYLAATLFDYQDIRLLALHRFDSAQLFDLSSHRPAGFDLQAYVESGALGFGDYTDTIFLVALFTKDVAFHLNETALSPDQTLTALHDGSVQLEASLPNSDQLRWWLRGFGSQVKVIQPLSLRREFAREAQALIELYQDCP